MGRAIKVDAEIEKLKGQVKRLETAFDGLASTVESLQNTAPVMKNVDLHETTKPLTSKKKTKNKIGLKMIR
jgi:hypothetical protein